MLRTIFCVAAVLTASLNRQVAAQTFQNGRAPLVVGQTQDVRLEIALADAQPANRTAVVQGLPSATTIKLRLDHISGANVPLGAIVVIRDASNNEVARYAGAELVKERRIWTPLIKGTSAQVEVAGQPQAGAEFRVLIGAVASNVPPLKPTLNIVRDFDLENIEYIRVNQPEMFVASRPVAKISFVSSEGPAACTGFMVTDDWMLTNHHCINTDEICKSADVIFGFNKSDSPLGDEMQKCLRLVDNDEDLDAALIEVAGSPGKRWGFLSFSDSIPTLNEAAVVVQHPAGFPKFVSRIDCVVSTMPADGVKIGKESDFGHSCDTMDGSSGSPVLRRADLKVMGLHHWGFVDQVEKWSAENRAVQIRFIRERFGL
ncbi:trypsin-like serine peptidase [Bradyrhizobium sp. DASA03005]|uniref:trypsin-like serine peptidase n=1 Tax=Bradyrhizobium sp. SPXBL-02 TaxID=3395912 RepID=UPI003F72F9E8